MNRFYDELDLLDEAQRDAEVVAEQMDFDSDVDRRRFVFTTLAAAAATTFGFGATALAQGRAGAGADSAAAGRGGGGGRGQGGGQPPAPLGQGDPPSWTFQPYPGGTGALLEKTYREKGVAAFARQKFAWVPAAGAFYIEPWGTRPVPNDDELAFLPAHRLAALIKSGKLTSTRLTRLYLDRMKKYDPVLLCAVTIMEEQGMADAAKADAEIKAGKYRGPLHGLPWGVKDLFAVKGTNTTWGSADFREQKIDVDSEVVVRLREAGAVLIAKLATGEFASGDGWFRGQTKNPWNTSQGSSGSSAGPGSATAGGCVAFAIGTETSGSIVSPTARCGLSALRPTFGRVSRYGGMVLSWSQDRVGPMTRTAEDAAMVFNAIHGADTKDPGSITMPFRFNTNINLATLRIGIREQNAQNPNATYTAFVDKLKELGAKPKPIGPAPTVATGGGGFGAESAAAFDYYLQAKAKELGVDVATLTGRGGGGGGGGAGRGGADSAGRGTITAAGGAAGADTAGRGGRAGGGGGRLGFRLPPGAGGRTGTALDFLQGQRRRLLLITAWENYLKDYDLYIGGNDTGPHATTGHPVAVVQMGFGVTGGGGGGGRGGAGGRGGRGGDSTAAAPPPPAPLNPQPITTQIAGNLYNDDIVLSVAHKYQVNTKWHLERPKMG